MSGKNLNELLELRRIGDDEFETVYNPIKMGNNSPIAYGGCALGVAAAVARQTVSSHYHAYSLMGNFLGPALTDRNFHCIVRRVRDTRTFATRHIDVLQVQDDGKKRPCLFMTADFQVKEPVDLMTFSAPPFGSFQHWSEEMSPEEWRKHFLNEGKIDDKTAETHRQSMMVHRMLFEQRNCSSGFSAQTLSGIGKHLPSDQDNLTLTDRSSRQWVKASTKIEEHEQLGAVTLFMDGALSFVPLVHDHKWLDDAGACSSLDFAVRFFDDSVDFNNFHLHEMRAIAGAEGRTFSEARLWDESGKMVATMTQQSIMRPKPEPKVKAKPSL